MLELLFWKESLLELESALDELDSPYIDIHGLLLILTRFSINCLATYERDMQNYRSTLTIYLLFFLIFLTNMHKNNRKLYNDIYLRVYMLENLGRAGQAPVLHLYVFYQYWIRQDKRSLYKRLAIHPHLLFGTILTCIPINAHATIFLQLRKNGFKKAKKYLTGPQLSQL